MLQIFSIPDPGSKRFRIPDPLQSIFNPQKLFLSSRKYDSGCSSRTRILIFDPSRIQDSGVKNEPDPGSARLILKPSAGGGSEPGRQDVRELPRVPPGRPLGAGADHRAPRAGNSRHQVAIPCRRPRVKVKPSYKSFLDF